VFIRAPWIAAHGERVSILAELDGHPVAARENSVMAVAFHPELTGDDRVHELFLSMVRARGLRSASRTDPLRGGALE